MRASSTFVDADFIVKGLNQDGLPQPTNLDRSTFVSESSLDTAISTVHAAKDLPSLTMNDKVFAARSTVVVFDPKSETTPPVEVVTPDETWSKDDIIDWLLDRGVEIDEDAEDTLSKEELLSLVQDILDSP